MHRRILARCAPCRLRSRRAYVEEGYLQVVKAGATHESLGKRIFQFELRAQLRSGLWAALLS